MSGDSITNNRLIRFDFGNGMIGPRLPRRRRRRTPVERWSRETRRAYRTEYRNLKRGATRIGPAGDQCLHLHRELEVKIQFVDNTAKLERFKHLPYKVAYLKHTMQNPTGGLEISHLCGDGKCINPKHMIAEDHAVNVERHSCHEMIRAWIQQQKKAGNRMPRGKYTFHRCKLGNCCRHGPENECFIMEGQVRNQQRLLGLRPQIPRRLSSAFDGNDYELNPRQSRRLRRLPPANRDHVT